MRKWLNPLIWVNGVDPLVLMKLSTEVNLKVLFQNDPCKNIVFGKTQTKLERITKDHSWALMRYAWIAALGLIPVCCVSAKVCVQQFIELASNFFRPLKIADSIAVVAALAVSIGSLSGFMRPASLFCRRSLGGLLELIHARRLPIVLWGVYPHSNIENIDLETKGRFKWKIWAIQSASPITPSKTKRNEPAIRWPDSLFRFGW